MQHRRHPHSSVVSGDWGEQLILRDSTQGRSSAPRRSDAQQITMVDAIALDLLAYERAGQRIEQLALRAWMAAVVQHPKQSADRQASLSHRIDKDHPLSHDSGNFAQRRL